MAVIEIPNKSFCFSNENSDCVIEKCCCGSVYLIPYAKCDENGGIFEFVCPICHTRIRLSRKNEVQYTIKKF